jgi:hypothetical protein
VIAVFCTAAFLFVGFAHALQHAQEPVPAPSVHVETAGMDVAPGPVDGTAAVQHCFGCIVIGLPTPAPVMTLIVRSAKFPWPLPDPVQRHFATAEGPIPIFMI